MHVPQALAALSIMVLGVIAARPASAQAGGGSGGGGASADTATGPPLTLHSSDGKFEASLLGIFQPEGAWISGSGSGTAGRGEWGFANSVFALVGRYEDVRIVAVYNPAQTRLPIEELHLTWLGWKPFYLVVGNQKEPFGQQALNAAHQVPLMERPLTNGLAPARAVGASLGYVEGTSTITAGIYGGNVNRGVGDVGESVGARLSHAWVHAATPNEAGRVVHVAAAVNHRWVEGPVAFSSFPESQRVDAGLIGTGAIIDAKAIDRVGTEVALQRGPLLIQSEYARASVSRASVRRDVSFNAGYVQAAFVLTGETRPYLVQPDPNTRGVFDRPTPHRPVGEGRGGGLGAVEIVGRVSALDLTDADVRGGRERDVTVGLNWFPNLYLRLAGDIVQAHVDRYAGASRNATISQIRAELHF